MGRHATYDREEVLQITTALFQRHGFHRVSVADLVEATGVNRFAIYEKFGGKEGLFYETLEYYHDVIIGQQLLGPLREEDVTPEAIVEMLSIVRALNADDQRRSGCLIVNANIELGGKDERVAQSAASVIEMFRVASLHVLRVAQRNGRLVPGQSPEKAADHIALHLQAFFALAYVSREMSDRLMRDLINTVEGWHDRQRMLVS